MSEQWTREAADGGMDFPGVPLSPFVDQVFSPGFEPILEDALRKRCGLQSSVYVCVCKPLLPGM